MRISYLKSSSLLKCSRLFRPSGLLEEKKFSP
jgi:hypothetical protein